MHGPNKRDCPLRNVQYFREAFKPDQRAGSIQQNLITGAGTLRGGQVSPSEIDTAVGSSRSPFARVHDLGHKGILVYSFRYPDSTGSPSAPQREDSPAGWPEAMRPEARSMDPGCRGQPRTRDPDGGKRDGIDLAAQDHAGRVLSGRGAEARPSVGPSVGVQRAGQTPPSV